MKQSQKSWRHPNGGHFHDQRNELFSGGAILQFSASLLEFIFVILSF